MIIMKINAENLERRGEVKSQTSKHKRHDDLIYQSSVPNKTYVSVEVS